MGYAFLRLKERYLTAESTAIFLLWLLVNGLLLLKNGIVTTGEAEKYIYQAHIYVNTGHPGSSNFWLYFVCIWLLSLCIRFHIHFAWMVALQLAFNLCATLFFFKTVRSLLKSRNLALIGTILLLVNIPYQAFNTFLQTESLFQSFSLLLTCYMIGCEKVSAPQIAVILLSLVVLSATRPNGLIYWPTAFLFISFTALKGRSPLFRLAFLGLGLVIFLCLLNTAMVSGGELDFILPFREEHVICGEPTLLQFDKMRATRDDNSIYGLFYYITHHFGQFTRLALLKSWSFWGLYRTYFSRLHNIYLVVYFYPITLSAFFSLAYRRPGHAAALICLLSTVLLTWVTVILTCDDWHNRTFLTISPFLLLLALRLFVRPDRPRPRDRLFH